MVKEYSTTMPFYPALTSLLLTMFSCSSDDLDGEKIRAGAFSDPATAVTVLNFGGFRWTEIDLWVAWSGPATLKSSDNYLPCTETKRIADHLASKDPERAKLLKDYTALTCLEKPGDRTGRWLLSHSSQTHWWRAWDHR
jgi:hypothetical protein